MAHEHDPLESCPTCGSRVPDSSYTLKLTQGPGPGGWTICSIGCAVSLFRRKFPDSRGIGARIAPSVVPRQDL